MLDPTVVRRVAGTAVAILLLASGRLVANAVTTVPGAYGVTVDLGAAAGSGLGPGSDVKVRGIRVGRVTALDLADGRAHAQLELLPEPPIPTTVRPVVTAKTLLGEKQLELRVDGPLDGPFLADGDRLQVRAGDEPTELEAVVAGIEEVFGALDPDRLAVLVEALGSFDRADATTLRRTLDDGADLAAFGARTGTDVVDRVRRLADVVEAIEDRGPDLDRIAAALPDAVGVVTDREAEIGETARALASFATGLAEFLEEERPTIRRLFEVSDTIGTVIDPRIPEVGRMIFGISRYALVFGHHGGSLEDGTEHAWFRAFIGEEGSIEALCEGLPPRLREVAPGCAVPPGDPGSQR